MPLYFAYGSNLCPDRMRMRCPGARRVRPLHFSNAALIFRAVADVEPRNGSIVPGALWEISKRDEEALDRFEGVSTGLYERWHVNVDYKGKETPCLFYKMTETGVMPPSAAYIDTIARGYRYWGLDTSILETALAESHDERVKTNYLRWRYNRDKPRLARRDHFIKPSKASKFSDLGSRLIKKKS